MADVGTARIKIEADASGLSDKLSQQVQEAVKKIDGILNGVPDAAQQKGDQAGKNVADGIGKGADQADEKLANVGKGSLDSVGENAAKAGADLADGISDGATKANESLSGVGKGTLDNVAEKAAQAGAGVAKGIQSGADQATNALGNIGSAGFDGVVNKASAAGSGVAQGIRAGADQATNAIAGIGSGGVFSSIAQRAASAGQAISSGIRSGAEAATNAIGQIPSAFGRIGTAASNVAGQIRNGLKKPLDDSHESALKIPGAIGGIATALGALAGPMAIFKAGWDRAAGFQEAEIRFKSIGVEGKKFTDTMNMLNGVVKGTSAGLDEASQQASMLMTSGVSGGNDLKASMEALVTASAVGGRSVGELGLVFQQVAAAGKLQAGDALQLSQASVPIWSWLAKSMGKSVAEVRDLSVAGKISYMDMVKAIRENGGSLAKDMSGTFKGQVGLLKSAMARMGEIIAKPLMNLAGVVLPIITAAFDAFSKPLRAVTGFMESGSVAADLLKGALTAVVGAMVVGVVIGFIGQLASMARVIQVVTTALKILNLTFLFSPWGLAIAGIGALIAAFVVLWKHSEGFRNFWKGLWDTISAPVRAAVDTVKNLWDDMWSVLKGDGVLPDSPLQKMFGKETMNDVMVNVANVRGSLSELWEALKGNPGNPRYLEALIGAERADAVIIRVASIKDAMGELWQALKGGDGGSVALETLFGVNGGQAVAEVFRIIGESARQVWDTVKELARSFYDLTKAISVAVWDALVSVLKALWDVLSAVAKAVWEVLKALWPVLKIIGAIALGAAIASILLLVAALKIVAVVFQALGKVISWLVDTIFVPLIEIISQVVSWLVEKLGAAISWVVELIGNIVAGIINFVTSVPGYLQAGWDAIVSGFQAVGEWLSGIWDGIWGAMQTAWEAVGAPVWEFIKNAFLFGLGVILMAWDWLKLKWEEVWGWLGTVWETIGQPVVDWVIGVWQGFVGLVTGGWGWIVQKWNEVWGWLGVVWQTVGQPIVDFVISVWNGFVAMLTAIWNGVSAAWSWLWNGIVNAYHAVVDPLVAFIQTAFQVMGNIIRGVMDGIGNAISAAGRVVSAFYSSYVSPMVNSVKNGFTSVLNTVRGWKDGILGALRGAGSWLVGVGRDLVQGMINGIGQMVGNLLSAVSDFAGKAISRAKSALGIHSPSRVFAEIGRNVGEGMVQGIDSMQGAVGNATAGLASAAVDSARPVAAQVQPVVPSVTPTVSAAPVAGVESPSLSLAPPVVTQQAPEAFGQAAASMQATTAGVLTPMFTSLGATSQWLGGVMTQQAQGVISPTWSLMAQNMMGTQANVINPTMLAAGGSVTQFALTTWGQIAGPVKQALNYLITLLFWALNSGVNPVMSSMRNSLNWLVNGFVWAVNSIGSAWGRLRELTAAPVRFTIGTVFNNGLVGMWNSVSELIGTKKMAPYPLRFATGGFVSGPGGPTDDKIPALLSNGEYVLTAKAVDNIGVRNLDAMNSGAVSATPNALRSSKQQREMFNDHTFRQIASRYAGGGIVKGSPAWRDLLRGYNWARSRSGRPYVFGGSAHGSGGTDCSGYMSGIADVILGGNGARQWATGNFPGTQRGAWARGLSAGFAVGIRNGGPGGGHTAGTIGGVEGIPAVNVESGGSPSRVKFGAGAVGATDGYFNQHWFLRTIDGGRFVPGMGSGVSMGEMIAAAVKPFRDRTQAALRGWAGKPGLINTLPGAVDKAMDSKARAMIDKKMAESSVDPGGTGVQRWAPLVSQLLRLYGHPASWLGITLKRMNQESGGNPRAINNWDINAKRGDPSKGLMQVIGSTFAAHRDPRFPNDIWDPKANIAASMRYTMRTYGSLPAGYGRAGGYAHGGLMGVGQGLFHKTAFKPERVLSPEQTESFDRLVRWLDAGGSDLVVSRDGAAPAAVYPESRTTKQIIVTQNITAAEPRQVADTVESRLMALM